MDRPVPAVHRYSADGLPTPILPVPLQPATNPWLKKLEEERERERRLDQEDPIRAAYEALKAKNDAREEARRRRNQN